MWYFSPSDGFLRQSTYVASINHKIEGGGYVDRVCVCLCV
jgi:hypothetical protein